MTDVDLVHRKLAFIETSLRELRELGRPDALESDIRERRFVEHTLQVAIQAALDVASHIVSDERLGEPRSNHDLFAILGGHGWIAEGQRDALTRMIGFRNVLVHGYTAVDVAVLRDVLEHHLGDLEAFIAAVRGRL